MTIILQRRPPSRSVTGKGSRSPDVAPWATINAFQRENQDCELRAIPRDVLIEHVHTAMTMWRANEPRFEYRMHDTTGGTIRLPDLSRKLRYKRRF